MSEVYYNEIDPFCCAWLRNLMDAGHIPQGTIDQRSIADVRATDLVGYAQCHFFAGIAGWPYALQRAGWPPNRPVWTGSCPCQPFSSAGRAGGLLDARHLWPTFRGLIAECHPPTIVGEQVASAAGRAWLAGVRTDLEELGYAVGASDLCAASVGAPHIRQRLYWVAHATSQQQHGGSRGVESQVSKEWYEPDCDCEACGLVGAARKRAMRDPRILQHADGGSSTEQPGIISGASDVSGGLGVTQHHGPSPIKQPRRAQKEGRVQQPEGSNPWDRVTLWRCRDGKTRRLESGCEPLVDGIPQRVGRLRAYGNAIVPHVAAVFIRAFLATEVPHG